MKRKQPSRQITFFDITGELPPAKGGTIHDETAIGGLFSLPAPELAPVVRGIAQQDLPPSERLTLIDWLCAEYDDKR